MQDTVNITCPGCTGINRVLIDRLDKTPLCGRCAVALLEPRPLELDGAGLGRFLSKNDLPIMVDFWSPGCGPCQMMAPAFEQAALSLAPRVRLVKMDTQHNQAEALRHNIRSVPTLAMFRRGREIARIEGAMPTRDIVSWAMLQL